MFLRFPSPGALVASLVLLSGTALADTAPTFIREWGDAEKVDDRLDGPRGLAMRGGDVVVLDVSGRMLTRYSTEGQFVSAWNIPTVNNRATDILSGFYGIAGTPGGNLIVTREGLNLIDVYSSEGVQLRSWGNGEEGPKQPRGVAVSSSGFVYVADSGNHRILKYKDEGTLVGQWGSFGTGDGQFNTPSGVAVSDLGHVFVVDRNNNRIQRFTENGEYVTQWGSQGSGDGQFLWPEGITTDHQGNVYVVDSGHDRVLKFSAEGAYLFKFATDGEGESISPFGIAVDDGGNVYVSDTGRNRILKFGYPIAVESTTWSGIKTRIRAEEP